MAIVETPQPLSIESFSYSWLIDLKPSLDQSISDSFRAVLNSSDESSFIEMDPNMPPSKRFKKLDKDFVFDFDFDLPCCEETPAAIVHADELFSNGLLLPLFDPSKIESSVNSSPLFSDGQKERRSSSADNGMKFRCSSLRRCRSLLSRKTFEKYLDFMCPLLEKIRCCRLKSKRNRGGGKRIWAVKSGSFSTEASPRTSVGSCGGDWRRSFDSEGSIHEAVLHCKRSIGM